jgi:hypothetical protein
MMSSFVAERRQIGTPEDTKLSVGEIVSHKWKGKSIEFLVKWNLGDSTWEPLANCNELVALDSYLMLMDIKDWHKLPKRVTKTSQSGTNHQTCAKYSLRLD